ncbi:hypothetical protein B5X24_HaOG216316 [Helicoverpa armigera]|nr:hypothetical protein B5X24_HaOG216316 [Helicoverpa armigera]
MSCAKAAHQTIAVTARAQLAGRSQTARELHIRGTFARCGRTLGKTTASCHLVKRNAGDSEMAPQIKNKRKQKHLNSRLWT